MAKQTCFDDDKKLVAGKEKEDRNCTHHDMSLILSKSHLSFNQHSSATVAADLTVAKCRKTKDRLMLANYRLQHPCPQAVILKYKLNEWGSRLTCSRERE